MALNNLLIFSARLISRIHHSITEYKDYLFILCFNLFQKCLTLLVFSFLAKKSNLDLFGLVRYNMVASNLYFLPLVGIPSAMLTFISRSKTKSLKSFYLWNTTSVFFSLLFIESIILSYLRIDVCLILFFLSTAIEAFYSSFISSISNVKKLSFYRLFVVLIQLIALFFYLTLAETLSYLIVSLIFTIPSILTIFFLEYYDREFYFKFIYSRVLTRKTLLFSIIATLGSVSYTFINSINAIILKKYESTTYISYYSSAEMIASIFLILPLAFGSYNTNALASLDLIQKKILLTIKNLLMYFFASILMLILIFYYKESIFFHLFGSKMMDASKIVVVFSLSSIFLGISLFFSQFYFSISKPYIPAISLSIGASFIFFSSKILIREYDIVGSVYSLLTCSLIVLVIFSIHFTTLMIKSFRH